MIFYMKILHRRKWHQVKCRIYAAYFMSNGLIAATTVLWLLCTKDGSPTEGSQVDFWYSIFSGVVYGILMVLVSWYGWRVFKVRSVVCGGATVSGLRVVRRCCRVTYPRVAIFGVATCLLYEPPPPLHTSVLGIHLCAHANYVRLYNYAVVDCAISCIIMQFRTAPSGCGCNVCSDGPPCRRSAFPSEAPPSAHLTSRPVIHQHTILTDPTTSHPRTRPTQRPDSKVAQVENPASVRVDDGDGRAYVSRISRVHDAMRLCIRAGVWDKDNARACEDKPILQPNHRELRLVE